MLDFFVDNMAYDYAPKLRLRLEEAFGQVGEVGNYYVGGEAGGVRVWVYETLRDDIAEADFLALCAGFDTLTVATSKATIVADNLDQAVITCAELPAGFDYLVHPQSGAPLASGSVSDGSIEFSTDTSGTYIVEIREQGSYRSGFITVEAV